MTEAASQSTYLKSLNTALHGAMQSNNLVHFLGEDVLDPYGGAFKVSAGLSSAFPGRVHTTPISEGGFTGVATGMALRGMRPVVEIMFGDFMTLTFDQIINHMVKFRTMYGRTLPVPVVVRTPMGGGRGYGATHSQSIEKHFLGVPDLTVVAPSLIHDPGELLKHAILRDDGPVLFIEHKLLYPQQVFFGDQVCAVEICGDGPYETRILRNFAGGDPDVVIIGYGGISRTLVEIARDFAEEEIRLSVVLPSRLSPLDIEVIAREVGRCGRAIVAEEGTAGFGWGSEIAAQLHRRLFRSLKAPVELLASRAAIIPTSPAKEAEMLLGRDEIEAAILKAIE